MKKLPKGCGDGCWMCRYYLWEIEDREVIGNIYENKDY